MARVKPTIESLRPYEAGKPIAELERELGVEGAVKLASNENPWGAPPGVAEAVRAAMAEAHIYPDAGCHALRQVLSARHDIAPTRLNFGNGSNELLSLIVKTFTADGDTVLSSAGSFIAYPIVAAAHGRPFVAAPLGKEDGYDLDALLARVDRTTRVVFIANPNNPTGTYLGHTVIAAFIEAVREKTAPWGEPPLIVLDEAYVEYVAHPDPMRGLELAGRFDEVIVTRTFSKAYGMAALRFGYAVASPEIADYLNRVREPFNVNALAQAGALAALADEAHVEAGVRACLNERTRVEAAFHELGLRPVPSQANFIFTRLSGAQARHIDPEGSGRAAAQRLYDALLRRGVIVRPMGPAGFPDALRITIGLPAENDRLLSALRALLPEA